MKWTREHSGIMLIATWVIILIMTRVTHLSGPIDEPHAWRKCDTANYALAFHKEGIDLLRPQVCWMGGHKTLLLEFPLPEAIYAIAYHVLGFNLAYARVITLLFFAGSAIYLYLLAKRLFGKTVSALAAGIYTVLPLSIVYSHAVHIDFFAVFFAHAMVYHMLRGYDDGKPVHNVIGALFGCAAFLIKAPYAFFFALPLLAYMLYRPNRKRTIVTLVSLAVPAACFVVWRMYAHSVNSSAPDWSFIPGYHKHIDMGGWYFGPLAMRWNREAWQLLGHRILFEATGVIGLVFAIIGLAALFVDRKTMKHASSMFAWGWVGGCVLYLLIFFNLNVRHNYYQIPFLPLAALLAALGLDSIRRRLDKRLGERVWPVLIILFAVLGVACVRYAQTHYYVMDYERLEAGKLIESNTPPESLVVICGPDSGFNDPRLLYRAHRNGWSIDRPDISKELVDRLQKEGATHFAVLANGTPPHNLLGREYVTLNIRFSAWKIFLCRL